MGILTDGAIRAAMERGEVVIRPMAPDAVGTNSIDLHLGRHLATYERCVRQSWWNESLKMNELVLRTDDAPYMRRFELPLAGDPDPGAGLILEPGELYLGATVEWCDAGPYVPMLEGTSSAGRLGISVHATAGVGDVGFAGHWTLELSVVRPVRVFGGEPIAQLVLHEPSGMVLVPYGKKKGASYVEARVPCPECGGAGRWICCSHAGTIPDPRPQPSRLWKKARWLG